MAKVEFRVALPHATPAPILLARNRSHAVCSVHRVHEGEAEKKKARQTMSLP